MYIRGELRIFEYKPPPQSGLCLLLKKGGGAYFREDTVLMNARLWQSSIQIAKFKLCQYHEYETGAVQYTCILISLL
jgi:hypothetical protein